MKLNGHRPADECPSNNKEVPDNYLGRLEELINEIELNQEETYAIFRNLAELL